MTDKPGPLNLATPPGKDLDVMDIRRFLPAFANTPRRAAVSTALIAGIAAGPLAGHASAHTASPTANPVIAAVTGASAQPAAVPATSVEDRKNEAANRSANRAANGKTSPAPSQSAQASQSPAPPPPPPAPTQDQTMPNGVPGDQTWVSLDNSQNLNARAVIKATKELNLPPRAAVIALATSLQETKLVNYGDLGDMNDHDSLGLFQQRPSTGWGAPEQLVNPDYSTKAFLNALVQVPGWQTLPLTDAAQTVQVSAFGDRYAQWEVEAADIVHDAWNLV
jgi:hypothetical protein